MNLFFQSRNISFLWFLLPAMLVAQQSANIEFLGNANTYSQSGYSYSGCWGYTAPNGREYALLGVGNGTSIVDITDAPALQEVAFIPGPPSAWREIKTYQQYAYIVSLTTSHPLSGVQIVDLSELPATATLVKTYVWIDTTKVEVTPDSIVVTVKPQPAAETVSVAGKCIYLHGGLASHMRILDLTDPVNPTQAGTYYGGFFITDSYVRSDTIFASFFTGAIVLEGGVDIIDARNKANAQLIKRLQYPGSGATNSWTTEDGKYLLTADGTTDGDAKTLKIWDIHDIQNPVFVAEVGGTAPVGTTLSYVNKVFVKGNLAYVTWYADGLKVIDITEPTEPKLVGYYDTVEGGPIALSLFGAWGAYPYYSSGKVIVSDTQTGLYVLRYTGPMTSVPPLAAPIFFALHQNYPNPFNPQTVIRYQLPFPSRVSLKVYNVLGREVAALVDGEMNPGEHHVSWDAARYPGGIYFYRLSANNFVETKKLVLVK